MIIFPIFTPQNIDVENLLGEEKYNRNPRKDEIIKTTIITVIILAVFTGMIFATFVYPYIEYYMPINGFGDVIPFIFHFILIMTAFPLIWILVYAFI